MYCSDDFSFFSIPSPDYSKGFGGKYGVDKEKVDKSAVGFEYQGKTEKHESQKGFYFKFYSMKLFWVGLL